MNRKKAKEPGKEDAGTQAGTHEQRGVAADTSATENVETSPQDRIAQVAALSDERDRLLEGLKRAKADLINYQSRVERDMAQVRQFALQEFVAQVLDVVDDFDRALEAVEGSGEFDALLEGVRLMEGRLKKLLSDAGVAPIEAAGKPFDPHLHEAVLHEENADAPANTVIEEFQRGYMLHDRVLRPSRVKVSKAPEKAPEEAPDNPGSTPGGAAV